MSRRITLLLVAFLTVSNLIMFEAAPALAYIKPWVPEFTVKIESNPYYVPETYRIDPYTGENVTASFGYWVENKSLVFTIKNQPFTPYTDTDGNNINLSYNIRAKGHYEDDWTKLGHFDPSDSEYTVKAYAFGYKAYIALLSNVPDGGKLDFQVDARVGYYTVNMTECKEYFTGETSGWSETYTMTIGESQTPSPSPTTTPDQTPTPYQEPQQSEQEMIIGVAIAVATICAALVLRIYFRKKNINTEKVQGVG